MEEENNFLEKRNEELMIDRRDICLERNDIFEENQQLKQQLKEYSELGTPKEIDDTYRSRNILDNNLQDANRIIDDLVKQLHDLPKQIVKEIKDIALDYWDFNSCEECGYIADLSTLTIKDFDEVLDTILKKFGEENNL